MKKADAQALLRLMDELTELMSQYNSHTDSMMTSDLSVIQQTLLTRNELMEQMKRVKQEILELANSQQASERELIKAILNNREIAQELPYELRQLQAKMRRLHDIKTEVEQKDKKVTAIVCQSYEDVKTELEALKVDKKKIDYYSSVKLVGKGRQFNTNS